MQRSLFMLLCLSSLLLSCQEIPDAERIVLAKRTMATALPLQEFQILPDTEGWTTSGSWDYSDSAGIWSLEAQSGSIQSAVAHRDLELFLEVKLEEGSQLTLLLENQHKVLLTTDQESGTVASQSPALVANRKAGLWQTFRILYSAELETPDGNIPPRVLNAELNGIPVHELLTLNAGEPGPLLIEAEGKLSIRNLRVKYLSDSEASFETRPVMPFILSEKLLYTYYERESFALLSDFSGARKVASGVTSLINIEQQKQRNDHYGLIYKGNFIVPHDGRYEFLITSDDGSRITIDGKDVAVNDGTHPPETVTGTVDLTAGAHEVEISFFQGSGGASFRVDYRGRGLSTQPFFSPETGNQVEESDEQYILQADLEPIVQRGFIAFPPRQALKFREAPARRTHTVSVGGPNRLNYTIDAGQGSLLMFWKGDFVNALNMWEGRGNWQNLMPLGPLIVRSGKPDFVILESKKSPWPDSLEFHTDILPKGYSIEDDGWPSFTFMMGQTELADKIFNAQDFFERQIRLKNPTDQTVYVRLASGDQIEYRGEHTYAIQGPGYLIEITSADIEHLYIRETETGEELVSSLGSGNQHITYRIRW